MIPAGGGRIALALSGGGIRAMVFHLGVLKCLAERGLLEQIARVSTVSGGSLLVGLMLEENGLAWPSSGTFQSRIYPIMREKLTSRSLQWSAVRQLLRPWNFRYILSRANLMALALKNEWQVTSRLSDMPSSPEWSINGTTAEDGKRFRFKKSDIGDYTLGYAKPGNYPLANALAVSAAFPGGFGPLTDSKSRWCASSAQAMRAFLLANATAATLRACPALARAIEGPVTATACQGGNRIDTD